MIYQIQPHKNGKQDIASKHVRIADLPQGLVAHHADHPPSGYEALLKHINHAALVVAADGMLVHANARGQKILAEGQPLRLLDSQISCHLLEGNCDLSIACRNACAPASRPGSIFFLRGETGTPALISVTSFRMDNRSAVALIQVFAFRASEDHVLDALRRFFGLTAVEAAVAMRVAACETVRNLARDRGITVATARSHVKNILKKMGCRRQIEVNEIISLIAMAPSAAFESSSLEVSSHSLELVS